MIKLSVIIPTFNRRRVLERTLPSLLTQDIPPDEYEIIVVIDGSTDGTADMLRGLRPKCALRILETLHRGPAAARNMALQTAVGELVLFLDDDLLCSPGLLQKHCASHFDSSPRVVHGPIYVAPNSTDSIIRYLSERFYENYYGNLSADLQLNRSSTTSPPLMVLSSLVNSSMPREILRRAGGFDEQILAAEDLELGLRLWKMGITFGYQPAALVREFYVKTSREHLEQQTKLMKGDLLICSKHPEYRPHSVLSALGETRGFKASLRAFLVQFPISPMLLAFPFGMEAKFYRLGLLRKPAARLLKIAERMARLRCARKHAGSWKVLSDQFGRACPGLMYHHVGPSRPGTYREMTVSPQQFKRQIGWLARQGYVGIRPSDWLRWLREGTGLPDKPILLTFDDSLADIAEYALPVLREYGFGAAVFVVTGRLGGTNTWDEAQGCGTLRLMTAEQVRSWSAQGIEFGAHSRTHADLTKLSENELSAEIVGSKEDLSALLGSTVLSFAYPYGESNDTVQELTRTHFDLAFGVQEGLNYLRGDRIFSVELMSVQMILSSSLASPSAWGDYKGSATCVPGSACVRD